MKKAIFALLILFASLFFVFSYDGVQPLTGYIYSSVSFAVDISTDPFNLAYPVLADDSDSPSHINGLRIGSFSLTATSSSFKLYITHDKLHLVERTYGVDDKPLSSIDYRLFMELGPTGFASCLSDSNPDINIYTGNPFSTLENYILVSGFSASLDSQGFYVSLYDHTMSTTTETVNELMAGTYASTIYFYLEVGE